MTEVSEVSAQATLEELRLLLRDLLGSAHADALYQLAMQRAYATDVRQRHEEEAHALAGMVRDLQAEVDALRGADTPAPGT